MTVFVSYSSRDRDAVKSLTQGLQDADEQVWMDQRLAGGEAWWRAILEQIRGCDVFIVALSQNSIESRPCQAELQYAQALGLPILPVQVGPVDSMQLNPLATVQAIDYRHPTPDTGMRLIAALHWERARRQPLPSPLPDEPAVPFEYLIRLYTIIAGPDQLSPRDQAALVAQLQVGLREDGQHEAARKDIVMLLGKLRDREDVTYRTRTDVDVILASIDAVSATPPPTAAETTATTLDALSDSDLRVETDDHRVMDLLADPGWADALSAFFAKRWPEAVERFEALHARYPGEARVDTRLKEAQRQRDIAAWSDKADTAAADGDWDTVVSALENLIALDPAYPDVAARLEQARTAQRRKTLVDEMTALHQAGRWEAVVAAAQELARIDPDNPDPGGIVSDAKTQIREAELADRYAQALNELDQEHWQQAADLLTAIEQEQPGYRDVAALFTTAQRQRDLAQWSDQAAEAAEHEDWDAAVSALEQICAADPTYRGAGARLEQARSAQRLRSLLEKVKDLHQAGRWKEVVAAADELTRLDPDNRDPGGIVADAKAKIREAQLGDRYAQALNHLDQQQWQQAVDLLATIEQEHPGYRDAAIAAEDSPTQPRQASRSRTTSHPASIATAPL